MQVGFVATSMTSGTPRPSQSPPTPAAALAQIHPFQKKEKEEMLTKSVRKATLLLLLALALVACGGGDFGRADRCRPAVALFHPAVPGSAVVGQDAVGALVLFGHRVLRRSS